MTTTTEKKFDTVKFFRNVKEKLAKRMEGMTLQQKKEFMQQIRESKIKISLDENCTQPKVDDAQLPFQ